MILNESYDLKYPLLLILPLKTQFLRLLLLLRLFVPKTIMRCFPVNADCYSLILIGHDLALVNVDWQQ